MNLFLSLGPPKFLSTPSVIVGDDGFSYIVGCEYLFENLQVDLAIFAYLRINGTVKIKLNGSSRRLNENTFQLPHHIFITPGEYQCLVEAASLFNVPIVSKPSLYISVPGLMIFKFLFSRYKTLLLFPYHGVFETVLCSYTMTFILC